MLQHMSENGRRTISELRQDCRTGPLMCRVGGQVEELTKKDSANGKPYWELKLRDATDVLTLRAWMDTAAFDSCEDLERGGCVEIEGEFLINGSFGLDGRPRRMRPRPRKILRARGTSPEDWRIRGCARSACFFSMNTASGSAAPRPRG